MGFGAEIESSNGSEGHNIVCDNTGNNYHYVIEEVDRDGAVVKINERYQSLTIENEQEGVHLLSSNFTRVKPGEAIEVEVGSHMLTVKGTHGEGIVFNGNQPNEYSRELEEKRYPSIHTCKNDKA